MPRMQDNMKKMESLMAKIHASKEGPERQQLLQQHSKAMQEQMQMMREGDGMMGGAISEPPAQGGPSMSSGMMNQMMTNHQAMRNRMAMMEMMMGQMLQHQEAQQDKQTTK